jgi:hypothetical protein
LTNHHLRCEGFSLATSTIDLSAERTLSLSAAARLLPPARRGRPVTISCVLRWILDGVRISAGEVVRLEAIRLGGRWLTSVEALHRFGARLTPQFDDRVATTATSRTPNQRQRARERADEELKKMGF